LPQRGGRRLSGLFRCLQAQLFFHRVLSSLINYNH
jgi:hypothetical protein